MPTFWILLVLFLATLVQCTFGFGNALIAMPVLAFFVPLPFASPLVAMTSMTVTVVIVLFDWRHVEFGDAARLVAGSVFGIPLGLWLLTRADERLVKGVLAVVIGSFAVYSLAEPRRFHLASDRWGYGFGWIAGVLGGAYNTSGPPLVVFGSLRDWSAKQFRATLQGYFLLAGTLVLLGHALNGLWTDAVLKHYALGLPLMAVAFVLGSFLSLRLSQERFQRTNHFVLLAIAFSLLANVLLSNPSPSQG
jgi:uncharacterized membrane protein YfcA